MHRFTLALCTTAICAAQTAAFDVVSIKPSPPYETERSLTQNPGPRLTTENATLKMLMMFAYQMMPDQISGGPSWVESDGFDIDAKASNPKATQAQLRQMLQTMLAERFQLQVHRATKELAIYALVQAKGGTKLTESHDEAGNTGVRILGAGRVEGVRGTMPMLATALSKPLKRRVVDQTGLNGAYTFRLQFTPDNPRAEIADGPSIFTALEEQLGLALKSTKGPVESIVIDRAVKPAAN